MMLLTTSTLCLIIGFSSTLCLCAPLNGTNVTTPSLSASGITRISTSTLATSTGANSTSHNTATATSLTASRNSTTSVSASATSTSVNYMSQNCKVPEITDARTDPAKRWAAVHADDAWKDAVDSATKSEADGKTGGLSFPELVSNFVHGPEDMQCDNLAARSGCGNIAQCWNYPAAGYFITNSMVSIANVSSVLMMISYMY